METKMTKNGVSVCAKGQERYEKFADRKGKQFFQYDYRDTDSELFSTVAPTLEQCREKRDQWLSDKLLRISKRQEIIIRTLKDKRFNRFKFQVICGNRQTFDLGYAEMIGLVSALTMPEERPTEYLLTELQRQEVKKIMKS